MRDPLCGRQPSREPRRPTLRPTGTLVTRLRAARPLVRRHPDGTAIAGYALAVRGVDTVLGPLAGR